MMTARIDAYVVTSPASREELLDLVLRSIAQSRPTPQIAIQPVSEGLTSTRDTVKFTVTMTSHELGAHLFAGIFYEDFDKYGVTLTIPMEGVDEPAAASITLIDTIE